MSPPGFDHSNFVCIKIYVLHPNCIDFSRHILLPSFHVQASILTLYITILTYVRMMSCIYRAPLSRRGHFDINFSSATSIPEHKGIIRSFNILNLGTAILHTVFLVSHIEYHVYRLSCIL